MTSLDYYDTNGENFIEGTINADMSLQYIHFYPKLQPGSRILDLGCGSGRDTKFFRELGYDVTALDGSKKICEIARQYTQGDILCMKYEDMVYESEFDGIWACASLLHVTHEDMPVILSKVAKALKKDGILYASYKYGSGEAVVGERLFSYYTENDIEPVIESAGMYLTEIWETDDVRPGREGEHWLNIIAKKR